MRFGLAGALEGFAPGHGDDFQFGHLDGLADIGPGSGCCGCCSGTVDLVVGDEVLEVIRPVSAIGQLVDAVVDGLAGRGVCRVAGQLPPRV